MENLVQINSDVSLPYGSEIFFKWGKPCPLCGKIIGNLENTLGCHKFIYANGVKFWMKLLRKAGFKVTVDLEQRG